MKIRASYMTGQAARVILLLGLVFGLAEVSSRASLAHSGATGVVKERMALMSSLGDAMKAMAAMFKKQAAYNPAAMARHATSINLQTNSLTTLFPHGSIGKPSKALPAIWDDWQAFQQLTTELNTTSARLAEIALDAEPRQARRQFAQVARTCSACHERFRIEP